MYRYLSPISVPIFYTSFYCFSIGVREKREKRVDIGLIVA